MSALIFLFGLFTAGHDNWNLKLLLANLFMVQDVFGQDMLNGVYWTLLIEIKFYVFIALQYLCPSRPRHARHSAGADRSSIRRSG